MYPDQLDDNGDFSRHYSRDGGETILCGEASRLAALLLDSLSTTDHPGRVTCPLCALRLSANTDYPPE